MQLLTIDDLNRPQHEIEPLIKEAQNLGNLYYEFIKHDDETYRYEVVDFSSKTRAAGFHASEISGCHRRLVYSISGTEKKQNQDLDVNMKMRFRIGTAVGAMIQADMHRMCAGTGGRIHFQDEVPIKPEMHEVAKLWGISSSADGLFTFCRWYPEYGQWYSYLRVLLEIKTESDKQYDKLKQPRDYHRDQTCVYMKCLDVPLIWTLYYNKSNSNITTPYAPWLERFDHKRWSNLEATMYSGLDHKNRGVLPERQEDKPCDWCPYAWHCQPSRLTTKRKRNQVLVSPGMLARG